MPDQLAADLSHLWPTRISVTNEPAQAHEEILYIKDMYSTVLEYDNNYILPHKYYLICTVQVQDLSQYL